MCWSVQRQLLTASIVACRPVHDAFLCASTASRPLVRDIRCGSMVARPHRSKCSRLVLHCFIITNRYCFISLRVALPTVPLLLIQLLPRLLLRDVTARSAFANASSALDSEPGGANSDASSAVAARAEDGEANEPQDSPAAATVAQSRSMIQPWWTSRRTAAISAEGQIVALQQQQSPVINQQ